MYNKLNIAFFSSSPHAIDILLELTKSFDIKLIVTSPNKRIGRKQEMTPSPLKTWAIENKIIYDTPDCLKGDYGENIIKKITELNIDLAVVIDYGLLIPAVVFNSPKFKTLNLHFSNLPKYRGPYPDSFVVLNGEKKTAISCVLIDEGFDTGRVLAQKEVDVKDSETAGELHQRLYKITAEILPYIINSWAEWNMGNKNVQCITNNVQLTMNLPPKKQDENAATFTKMLNREDGFIEWNTLIKVINNQPIIYQELPGLLKNYSDNCKNFKLIKNYKLEIRNFFLSLSPWPGIWTEIDIYNYSSNEVRSLNNISLDSSHTASQVRTIKRLKILKTHLENDKFVIDEVQLEGKKPVTWKQFLSSYKIIT